MAAGAANFINGQPPDLPQRDVRIAPPQVRLDDLLEVVPPARHGVDARIDGHAKSAALQRLDAPPCATRTSRGTSRHLGRVARFAPHLIPCGPVMIDLWS